MSAVCLTAVTHVAGQQPAQGTGRIAGVVVDATTGRPITGAVVHVVATPPIPALTDVEGRYRTIPLPVRVYSVTATMIGYAVARVDSVRVTAGEVVSLRIAMQPQAIQLQAVVATATGQRQATAAGLLAVQKNAPSVMDGISSEQMKRAPDSRAADAISRVTGVSVVDNKFVVVRGLTERYSNTLLNGVELASPEPTRRIVPLDIFPSQLLESIVAVKTATPDMPGDFAGGSVNIQTKDFPEQRVLELKISQGYNSLSTFQPVRYFSRNGLRDMTGFDGANRTQHPGPDVSERQTREFAASLAKLVRTNWTPGEQQVRPDIGVALQYGNQIGEFERALGYIFSFDYGFKTSYQPNEYFALAGPGGKEIETNTESSSTTANWGLLANATLRLGAAHTIGSKNMMTQESEEFVILGQSAFNATTEGGLGPILHRYQVRYLERGFLQSQLRGQHRFTWPFRTQWNWNATVSRATRDEPENRTLTYGELEGTGTYALTSNKPNLYWFRFLDDKNYGGNVDVSIPLGRWFGNSEALLKLGAGDRRKERDFDAYLFSIVPMSGQPPDGREVYTLPPDLVVAAENLGRNLQTVPYLSQGLPYHATDEVRSAFVQADLPLPGRVRFVGGVRAEEWALNMVNFETPQGKDSIAIRNDRDFLASANLTFALTESMNVRAAGYQTVSRPDPREIAIGYYAPVAGQCTQIGNPDLRRARITNADLRWEWYPAPGEIVSLSGFYKFFQDAIIEYVSLKETTCYVQPLNARNANTVGGELELRKGLGFVMDRLQNVSVGLNFTYSLGSADLILGNTRLLGLDLQDLSKYLVNASLNYTNSKSTLAATVLYNYFDDRVSLYGDVNGNGDKTPDIIEHGRGTLDVKITKRLFGVNASLSGRNLTNQQIEKSQLIDAGILPVGTRRQGVSLSLSLGYAF